MTDLTQIILDLRAELEDIAATMISVERLGQATAKCGPRARPEVEIRTASAHGRIILALRAELPANRSERRLLERAITCLEQSDRLAFSTAPAVMANRGTQ